MKKLGEAAPATLKLLRNSASLNIPVFLVPTNNCNSLTDTDETMHVVCVVHLSVACAWTLRNITSHKMSWAVLLKSIGLPHGSAASATACAKRIPGGAGCTGWTGMFSDPKRIARMPHLLGLLHLPHQVNLLPVLRHECVSVREAYSTHEMRRSAWLQRTSADL
jgi:hypothetical protein